MTRKHNLCVYPYIRYVAGVGVDVDLGSKVVWEWHKPINQDMGHEKSVAPRGCVVSARA